MGLGLGEAQTITTEDGRVWKTARTVLPVLEGFFDWIRAQVGDPYAAAERFVGKLPDAEVVLMVKEAQAVDRALKGLDITSPLFKEWMGQPRGLCEFFRLLLVEHHPDITLAEAFQVAVEVGLAKTKDIIEKASGEGAGPKDAAPAA